MTSTSKTRNGSNVASSLPYGDLTRGLGGGLILLAGCARSQGATRFDELEHVPSQLNQGDSLGAKDERVYRH